ncbi:MAG TPA: YihY/virulence factor BrkB family protein [Gemmatimonadaceae bacterium]
MLSAIRSNRHVNELLSVLREAWQEFERDHARYLATAMVFYVFVALVPLLLLLLALLGLLLRFSEVARDTERQVRAVIDANVGASVGTAIEQLLQQLQRESIVTGVVSVVVLMFTASGLFRHLRLSFRAMWKYTPPLVAGRFRVALRAMFVQWAAAYLMVLAGGLALIVALVLITITQWVNSFLARLPLFHLVPAWVLALPSSVILAGLTFFLLLKYLPPRRLAWRHVWLATTLCTLAFIVGSELIVLFGAIFRRSPSTLGAFGGLLALMVFSNKVSQLLFYGAEVCKVTYQRDATGDASQLALDVGQQAEAS